MAFAIRDRVDPFVGPSALAGLTVRYETNTELLAHLQRRPIDVPSARFAAGHRAYVAFLNGEPAAFGWVATRAA